MQNYDLLGTTQVLLTELSVCNWGSFTGIHTAHINPGGTLITGDNGAGKSTLIDGLMALLVAPGKAAFNIAAAQGDRTDRSLLTYMRGSFGADHDGSTTRTKNKRNRGVISGLRALYRFTDGAEVTMVALFWTSSASNDMSDVKRLYIVARQNMTLEEILAEFENENIRRLKQFLKNHPAILYADNKFGDYQNIYRSCLHLDNQNAPGLLSRALGLKKVDDLTTLIRDLVLEPINLRESGQKIVEDFENLKALYETIVDIEAQIKHLQPLVEYDQRLQTGKIRKEELQQSLTILPIAYAKTQVSILQTDIGQLIVEEKAVERALKACIDQLDQQRLALESLNLKYHHAGGGQLAALKQKLTQTHETLQMQQAQAARYQKWCQSVGIDDTLTYSQFEQHQAKAAEMLGNISSMIEVLQDAVTEIAIELQNHQQSAEALQLEITQLAASPDSNIDSRYQTMRRELVSALSLSVEDYPFIGELIDVKEEEKEWQGAIERALGGLRTTLLVPEKNYQQITAWLNQHHLGLHVRVQVVREAIERDDDPMNGFNPQGFLAKLIWKQHGYRTWLQQFLQRFDLTCVDSVEQLNVTIHSMTQQGLIQRQKGRFEKQDQQKVMDQRYWNIGFNNQTKLTLLKKTLDEQIAFIKQAETEKQSRQKALKEAQNNHTIWQKLSEILWEQIDMVKSQAEIADLTSLITKLENTEGSLASIQRDIDNVKKEIQGLEQRRESFNRKGGELAQQKNEKQKRYQLYQQEAAIEIDPDTLQLLTPYIERYSLEDNIAFKQIKSELEQQLAQMNEQIHSMNRKVEGIITSFMSKDQWRSLSLEWPVGLEALPNALMYLEALEKEGLPAHKLRFKERLNQHTTQSLADFNNMMRGSLEEIEDRIQVINRVLARTEFREGSFLRLGYKRERIALLQTFQQKIDRTLHLMLTAGEDDHEARFIALNDVITILDRACNIAPNTQESIKLLDTRYQLSFYASEIDRDSGEERDVWESSSGKSGGEKEAFAGTIIAASLAYVLTPEGSEFPVYSTVFLDEAFSNTAETVSRRVLKVFKALQLHINLITPYKNITIARESASSLLIVERDNHQHESRILELTWEELDAQRRQLLQQRVNDEIAGN
ncbi:hypothetical protein DC083_09125 [Ignatzschineria ureiclastica]|uniref:ATP-binding protein n=1 Tax=Ignatzschineria ureiclastica TaxID=472582 RepID=A0A2U2ACS4_9GAMM|nr:ATP-binding protein [Ignatzschineria ureiclastica]PWD80462.1 hypothetical protein DC083_09125 [Ignatzschineria ureiclastica]GGZ99316.1 ATP-binding protein [Ignatzschineria ureiclastica]